MANLTGGCQCGAVRYEWVEESGPGKSYVIGMQITEMSADDRQRFNEYLGKLP